MHTCSLLHQVRCLNNNTQYPHTSGIPKQRIPTVTAEFDGVLSKQLLLDSSFKTRRSGAHRFVQQLAEAPAPIPFRSVLWCTRLWGGCASKQEWRGKRLHRGS